MKKVTSMLLVFVLLVSPMKSVFAYKDETKEVCEDTETTWQRVKRKASETKQWILENKVKSAIMFASVVGGGIVIYYKRDRIKEFFFPTDVRPDHQQPPQGDGPDHRQPPQGDGPDHRQPPQGDGPDHQQPPQGDGPDHQQPPQGDGPDHQQPPQGDGPEEGRDQQPS